MTEQRIHTEHKLLKRILITVSVLLVFVVVARLSLKSSFVHSIVKTKLESLAQKNLNASLTVGDLEGDLWKEVLLTNVAIESDMPILLADTLYVKYDIWSLLSDIYEIDQLKAVGIQSYISETRDSVFNVQQLIKEEEQESEPAQFILKEIVLNDLNSEWYAPSYLPDSLLKITELSAAASFEFTNTISATLSSLDFNIEEGRLPEPIKVKTSGKVIDQTIDLEEMVIETSRSILRARAEAHKLDSTLNIEASTHPFSLNDIEPYLEADVPSDELEIQLSVKGSFHDLDISLNLDHQYAKDVELSFGLNLTDAPTLTSARIKGSDIDVAHFTQDSNAISLAYLEASLIGELTGDIENADLTWEFNVQELQYENYVVELIDGKGSLTNNLFDATIGVNPHLNEQIAIEATISNFISSNPIWNSNVKVKDFDISKWSENEELISKISLNGVIEGEGFSLSDSLWSYSIIASKNQIAGQSIEATEFSGSLNKDVFDVEGFFTLNESRIDFEMDAIDVFSDDPQYNYYLTTDGFDLSEINQIADFPTHLNIDIYGEGRGKSAEECLIFMTFKIDSSLVNGARFENMSAATIFTKGVLTISDGVLDSDIIEGEFSGRKNITDETDPDNWLLLDMQVKNIQPLAPLANVEELNATGLIAGSITQDTSKILRGTMQLNLNDIIIDSLFTASNISGNTSIEMLELSNFKSNLSIESPVISGIVFQDIEIKSEGIANEDSLKSTFDLEIVGSERGRLKQDGELAINFVEQQLNIQFDTFDFITLDSELALQKPFNIRINQTSISTDTLDLKSQKGAYLLLSVPYADSLEQYGWMTGRNFDFGGLQEVVFGERFLDGVISGQMFFNKSIEDVTGSGAFDLTRIKYGEIEADSIDIKFDLSKERLFAATSISWDNEEKVIGDWNVPFVLSEASELGDDFFSRTVEGSLIIKPSELTRFKPLLEQFGITETDGILSFDGTMNGTAGDPNFEGEFTLNDPVVSGIKLDTVIANFNYDIDDGGLQIESQVIGANQKVGEIQVLYPLAYDFRAFEVILPSEEQVIKIDAKSENFNLAVLNDFLDKEYLSGLTGTLNADVSLKGTSERMIPEGYLRLSNGKVSVPIAGITLTSMKSDVVFTEKGLDVKEISAQSGKGSFNAKGLIELEGIKPKTIDLSARATQFMLANTNDNNMVIDLDGKLNGKATTPKATGNLTIKNGFVYLQNLGENTLEDVQLDGEEIASFSPYDSLSIDMTVIIERNFYVRNRGYLDVELEMIGEVDAQKATNGELQLFGNLSGVEGYVAPLGKTFKTEEANITFSGPIDDYDLYAKSKYTPPTRQKGEAVEVFYIIDNTNDPEFSFESNPIMEQEEIVCYTLFNNPCLESWQRVLAADGNTSATDILTDVLLDEVEAYATRQLGVDVVQIDNSGVSGGTSIKTGWYINQRTFFAIINELTSSSPKTLFILEYILSENWDLIVTQGGDTRRGVDFRFQYDY